MISIGMTMWMFLHYTIFSYFPLLRMFASGLVNNHSNRNSIEDWLATTTLTIIYIILRNNLYAIYSMQ